MLYTLLPHQHLIRDWLRERPVAGVFAGMGLGKTAALLEHVSHLIADGRSKGVLIIAPLRVAKITWPNQLALWDHASWMRWANLNTPEGAEAWENAAADVYLTHFDTLASIDTRIAEYAKFPEDAPKSKPKLPEGFKFWECRGMGWSGGAGFHHYIHTMRNPRGRTVWSEPILGSPHGNPDSIYAEAVVKRTKTGSQPVHHPGIIAKFFGKRKSVPVDTLVLDESSAFKAHDSQRGKWLRAALPHFKRRYILTGTPAPNSYLDLQPQIRILDDGERLGRSFHQFRQTYFASDYMGFKWEIKPGAKEKIDAKIADICLTLSAEDWLKVPPCSTEDIEITLPSQAMKAYRKMEKEFLAEIGDGEILAVNAAVKAGKLLQMASGAVYDEDGTVHLLHDEKIKALKKLVAFLNGEPLMVFVHYRHEASRIAEELGADMFDETRIPEWQAGKFKVWVASPQSMSHGIDGLQMGGRHACWLTPTYSNEQYLQANARLVRQGQERETVIHRIIAKDTIDEAVIETLRDKESGQKGLMLALKNLRLLRK